MQKHCRDHEKRLVCRSESSASSWFQLFLQTIGLDAATSSPLTGLRSIVLPLGAERAREIKEKKQLAIADAGAAAAAAQSEG